MAFLSMLTLGLLGFRKRSEGSYSCLPCQGKSEVEEDGAVEIARCSRGQYFGELALVTNKPRAASAHAIGTVKCLGRSQSRGRACPAFGVFV